MCVGLEGLKHPDLLTLTGAPKKTWEKTALFITTEKPDVRQAWFLECQKIKLFNKLGYLFFTHKSTHKFCSSSEISVHFCAWK